MQRTMGMSHEQVDAVLNRKSGILGISEVSSDMRDIKDMLGKIFDKLDGKVDK